MCFFQDVIAKLVGKHGARKVAVFRSEIGLNPAYEITVHNRKIGVLHPGIGSAAAAAFLDEAIAMGGRKFIACGGAGVLRKDLAVGHLIVPNSAIRDEGASYHYLPPAREAKPHPQALRAIRKTLGSRGFPFIEGKTWTTDGFYRETAGKIQLRKKEGCLSVEMECASFFAVAKFRKVTFGQILYSGDDLSGVSRDQRGWNDKKSIREKVFWLAAEACACL
jgi:uridine phosphorylase